MMYDNAMAFDIYDREQAERLANRPVCSYCGEHIQGDYYYEVGSEKICIECMDEYCLRMVD